MKYQKNLVFIFLLLLATFAANQARAQFATATPVDPKFDPGNILSDNDALNAKCMSADQIQNFLNQKGGFLANYVTTNAHGTPKTAAQIIYDAAANNYDCTGVTLSDTPTEAEIQSKCQAITTVNPKFLLTLIQKEESLVEDQNPQSSQLDWAAGYGCPDGWTCNPYYKGFGKQVNSAALQFLYYMQHPEKYKYQVGGTYTMTDFGSSTTFTIKSQATAALYNYTPHVFNGNYNFYKLWNKYFPHNSIYYPDGALLQLKNTNTFYLISNNKKQPFANPGALISRFDPKKAIAVDQSVLDNYVTSTPLQFPNYSLIQTPDKKIYLLVDEKSRLIADNKTFKAIGFSKDEILPATVADLNTYKVGAAVTVTSTYAYGALLQDKKTGGVFYISEDTKAPIIDKILLTTKFKNRKIIQKTTKELAKYKTIEPVLLDDGELVRSSTVPTVYLISDGQKRPFASGDVFQELGYDLKNVITVSPQLLYFYPLGATIDIN